MYDALTLKQFDFATAFDMVKRGYAEKSTAVLEALLEMFDRDEVAEYITPDSIDHYNKLDDIEARYNDLKDDYQCVVDEMEYLKDENEDLYFENETRRNNIYELENKIANLEAELEELRSEKTE